MCTLQDLPRGEPLGGELQVMALLLCWLRHGFSQQLPSHPTPVPAGHIDPDGSLLLPAPCQHHFGIWTSERHVVLTFCSHSQLSRAFQEARRGAKRAADCHGAIGRPSLPTSGAGVRASCIATTGHIDLGRLHPVVGCHGVAFLHPSVILLLGARWEETSLSLVH